ncbi:glycosyltransferase family 4 protein [Amphritea balenae]|uniref:Glycosyltransferase family 4 protein n=1 Tax=Amphritea balenae TaxID=452629 RepID=A0A3P1SSZ5_9GAMM|nr:glycosyltransferase family 4 protein [Amphritea balenae]RRD00180.1 glycosyltransferase family 4 protein [Amphritea balenae]GGK77323.1 hypothetical protein GCM10007941_29330 [Amphritea balenae]
MSVNLGQKVAIVHDWFVDSGGAEKVVSELLSIFPDADVFSTVDYLTDKQRDEIVNGKKINTTFIQKLPLSKSYKKYFTLMPMAMASFDLSEYDLILSSSSSVAKGVITGADQVHICYCHSPMRYAWDLQEEYLRSAHKEKGFLSFIYRHLLHKMRMWDVTSSFNVDFFIANSTYISRRIKKVYKRDAEVIYPNVNVDDFNVVNKKSDYYFTCSRLVPYKRIDLIVEAFSEMKDKKLIVVGDGPEMEKISELATSNVELFGYQEFEKMRELMANAKAFVFAAEEDFGIVPVEAQACGTPVIAFGKGGALETVDDGVTGVFFDQQSVPSLCDAVLRFENCSEQFDANVIRTHAEKFCTSRFRKQIKEYVYSKTRVGA